MNDSFPISVTLSGIVMEVKLMLLWKALLSIFFKEDGNVKLSTYLTSEQHFGNNSSTVEGIPNDVVDVVASLGI